MARTTTTADPYGMTNKQNNDNNKNNGKKNSC